MSLPPCRVGIVIRTKDRPGFVTRALRSVLAQTYLGWRVILVNDGGDQPALDAAIAKDGLTPLLDKNAVQILHLPDSIGRSDAFNLGAGTLDSEFVCCLDDDDTWAPGFLEALIDLYDRTLPLAPDLGGVAALVTAVREDLVTIDGNETLITLGEDELSHAFRRTDFFLNPIAYATYRHDLYPVQWMLNRQAVLAAGGFPSVFNVMEDRAFMTAFLQRWRVAILDQKLAFHHRRARRKGDTMQSVVLNTLDNPSYDWRLFSDLAKTPLNSLPDTDAEGPSASERAGALLRATAATIIKELNDETSGLWHKINGETATLKARIEALDARIGGVSVVPVPETPQDAQVWSLWSEIGAQDAGFGLGVDTPFLSRLVLSMADTQPGLLMHASQAQHRMVVQIPRTHDWAALELSLDGLTKRGHGLRCEMILSHPTGYLFETALSVSQRDLRGRTSHAFESGYVHSCPPGGSIRVVRDFPVESFERGARCKFSLALPRQASDFRLIVHDLVVSLL